MFAQRLGGTANALLKASKYLSIGIKAVSCGVHTTNHIPILKADMDRLDCTVNPRNLKLHDATVIMLHGVGDTGFFMVPYAADFSRSLPNVSFICPTAPLISLTCRDGAKHHSWFDFPSWDTVGNNKCTGVELSVKYVNSLIDAEIKKGIQPKKIILCGFSQGAGIAIHTGLNRENPIGGIVSFCGCLPNDKSFTVNPNDLEIPLLMFHGTADKHVPYEFMQEASELIKSKGVKNVEFNLYPGVKHQISRRMIDLTSDFFAKTIGI